MMGGLGEMVRQAYDAASAGAQGAARALMSSIGSAASTVKERAAAAGEAGIQGALMVATAIVDGAVATGQGAYNVGGFALRASGEAAGAAASLGAAPYRLAKKALSPSQTPRTTLKEPCIVSWEGKQRRLEERNARIDSGKRSHDPQVRAAAKRLARNNEAVELARLSDDTYAQYPPTEGHQPPLGWKPMTDAELKEAKIDKDLLENSQAVIYRSNPAWPGKPKIVLAFRGTADMDDVVVDHDQAMGIATAQYESAARLGKIVFKRLGKDVLVTGHSLGGGKAQVAGAIGGLKGTMFNSAGPHPESVDGKEPASDQFEQYRTPGDPLTGLQNSPALQTLAMGVAAVLAFPLGMGMKAGDALQKAAGLRGLSADQAEYVDKAFKVVPRGLKNLLANGQVVPPAIGPVTEVPSLNDQGQALKMGDVKQHSITFLVNGIEQQKSEDMATLT
jgi:hypothetical protein